MNRAREARPDDMETAAFYALSHVAAGQNASDRMAYNGRAAEVLLRIYKREPAHPGAIHYTIHANDIDSRAAESLKIVRSYSGIAPDVPHALHMPTHIFVRLGEWENVIAWNRKSAAAALRLPTEDGISHHYPHALGYLVYAHLQRGEEKLAWEIADDVLAKDEPLQGDFTSAFHLASMPARYAVERRAWDEARTIMPRTPEGVAWDRFWWPESVSRFARGLGAVHTGDAGEAKKAERRMAELRDAAQKAGEATFAGYIEVDRLVLASWRAQMTGESKRALDLAREAVTKESEMQKHPVTPGALYPSQESLGDLLMALYRPQEALSAYESALAAWPGRFNSLAGAARSARTAGLTDRARVYYRTLIETASDASSSRPALAEARQFLEE